MKKNIIEKIKKGLEEKKQAIEKELEDFAKKDDTLKGDWDTKYPSFGKDFGSNQLEDEAKEVEEYGNLLPVEHSLETRLSEISKALKKIEEGKYGKCEKCGKPIPEERLSAIPEARFCINCIDK